MTETTAILIPSGDFRTNMERRPKVIDVKPEPVKEAPKVEAVPARTILPEQLTGYDAGLPVDPLKAMSDVPVDRPDLLGHRWKEGRCVNTGCGLSFTTASVVTQPAPGWITAPHGWTARCPGETPPAFVPRVVSWCAACLAPFEGKTCGCGG